MVCYKGMGIFVEVLSDDLNGDWTNLEEHEQVAEVANNHNALVQQLMQNGAQ